MISLSIFNRNSHSTEPFWYKCYCGKLDRCTCKEMCCMFNISILIVMTTMLAISSLNSATVVTRTMSYFPACYALCWIDVRQVLPYPCFIRTGDHSDIPSAVNMMTSSNGNIFRVIGHSCGEFTGPRWIPHTKASDTERWCFLWSASE